METLGDALPKEQERCRELLAVYKELGAVGAFGAMVIETALRKADQAVMSGDVTAMIQAYKELQACE